MSVKASVSISEQQDQFVRELVDQGRYSSVSAVIQHGLELLRNETDLKDAELGALRLLLDERSRGAFVSQDEGRAQTETMIARKRASRGL